MHIALRPVQKVHIHPLADLVAVQRAVSIGDDESRLRRPGHCAGKVRRKVRCFFIQAPDLQEHQRKAPHRVAPEHNGRVLPIAKAGDMVDVFIGQVDAAIEGDLPVDDQNFSVIAVIIMRRDKGLDGGKDPALDPQRSQALRVIVGQIGKLTGAVIQHPDIHALGRLAGQNLQNFPPHQPFPDDKILQEDKPLRLLQLLQQRLEFCLAGGEIGHLRALVGREAAAALQIAHQRRCTGPLALQSLLDDRLL